jgi:hypothetical protein
VTIATYPFAVNRNPTAAKDASCHLNGLARIGPQALATLARLLGRSVQPSVGCRPVDYEDSRTASGRVTHSEFDRAKKLIESTCRETF